MFGPYERLVQYYETDMMGIVHHSNYIRWFEEARIRSLKDVGFSYKSVEEKGIMIPVLSVSCNYRKSCTYGDIVSIYLRLKSFNGAKLCYEYEIHNEAGEIITTGESSHCFLSRDMKLINIRKEFPEFYEMLGNVVEASPNEQKADAKRK